MLNSAGYFAQNTAGTKHIELSDGEFWTWGESRGTSISAILPGLIGASRTRGHKSGIEKFGCASTGCVCYHHGCIFRSLGFILEIALHHIHGNIHADISLNGEKAHSHHRYCFGILGYRATHMGYCCTHLTFQ